MGFVADPIYLFSYGTPRNCLTPKLHLHDLLDYLNAHPPPIEKNWAV